MMKQHRTDNMPPVTQLWGMDWLQSSGCLEEDLCLTSIIILTCEQLDYTRQCLNSIFAFTGAPFELIIVDNGSKDGTLDYLASLSHANSACQRIKIIKNEENNGFAKGCNQGLAESHGEYLLLLNNDVVVTAGWLSRLVRALQNNDRFGFVGPMSNYVSGPQCVSKPQYNIRTLQGLNQFAAAMANWHCGQVIACQRVVGFCMLIKKTVIDAIGGLDECYGLGNFEDDDFCLRAQLAGYQGGIVKDCFIHHFGGRTFFGNNLHYEERLRQNWELFKEKWKIPPATPLGPTCLVPLESMTFDPAVHRIPIDKDKNDKESQIVCQSMSNSRRTDTESKPAMSLQEYCRSSNGKARWLLLKQLAEDNQPAPYMSILHDVSIIGPLLLHHGRKGRLHAIHIEQDRVSGDFSGSASCLFGSQILPEFGSMKLGTYLLLWGLRTDNFWHWMMEALSKVIMARACGFDGYYIVPPKYKNAGFIRESLEIIGISPDRICVYDGQPWRLESLYLPQWINGDYQLAKYPIIIDKLRQLFIHPYLKKTSYFERIYIARENENLPRCIVNEIQLMELLNQYDFHRVVMERYSLKDQIAIAAGANCLIAPHGAGMAHCLFMLPHSTVIELFPSTYINPCMLPVVERLNFRYYMIPSRHLKVFKDDNYEVLIEALGVTLRNEFGIEK
jgi:GT2 family glycosyltransferase